MNKNSYCLIVAIALFVFGNSVTAQTYSTGNETKKADVNMTELSNYYKENPTLLLRKKPFNESDEEEEKRSKHHKAHPSEIHMMQRNENRAASGSTHSAYLPASPAPADTFLSTISAGDIIPPDTHGAVDSQYCVTAINTEIHIQTRGGSNISNVGLDGFWASVLPPGTSTFDPRVHYDPFYKRWIMVTDAVDQATSTLDTGSAVLVAVSATNDPTGTWHMYAVKVDPTNASWMDFPNVGFNSKWIMVTGNMFANTGAGISGAVVYIFNYASIMAGTGAPFTKIFQSSSFAIAPAITYDPTEPNLYAIETWTASAGELNVWKVSGPVGSPVMASVGLPTSSQHWKGNPPAGSTGGGDFAPQVGGTNLLNIGDDRITRVMYRNHKLWCSYTAFLPATGTATRSSIMWWQIDTNANPLQIGLIDDPTSHNFYAYSSIAVNAEDDALIGFAAFSNTIHPSAAYALHMGIDPVDSMRPLNIYRHGQAYYYETFGGNRNRWGDFSAACIDPRNDTDFWTIQESSIVGTSPNWDTWWASIQFCPKPIGPTLLSSPASPCIGNLGTYKINPVSGATSYLWTVSGTGWSSTSSTADSINVTIGTGAGTITVLAYNACGEGETSIFNTTPATVPAPFGISIINAPCVGSPTAVFSASSPGASYYNWQAIGTGWSGTGSSASFTANVGTGTGMIICNSVNACGPSQPDTLSIAPSISPVAGFSVASHATVTNVSDLITFTGTAPAGSTYTWNYTGGVASPGGTGPGPQTVYWTIAGTKTITLTVNNGGCTSTYSDTVNVGANGVQQLNAGNADILIMPNPNDGSFSIVLNNNNNNKNVAVTITDMQGRTVYTNDFGATNKGKLPVSAGNLSPGNYTVSINVDGLITTKKITVTK